MAQDRFITQVKSLIPITWDAMTGDKRVGEPVLAARIEATSALVFGDVPTEAEEDALNFNVVEYVAKVAVLEMIPSLIDYWKEIAESLVTTGTNEQTTYTDRIEALKELKENLLEQLARLEPIVEPLIPVIGERRSQSRPLLNTMEDELLTPSPQDMGAPYGPKVATQ